MIPKFRAYIKATGEMHQVDEINTWLEYVRTTPMPKEKCLIIQRKYPFKEIVLMQYIGLKDCTKKKIYAGDILTLPRYNLIDSFIGNHIGVVYWCEEDARFMIDIPDEKQIINMECVCVYEVIGNIHQDPYLLEETK